MFPLVFLLLGMLVPAAFGDTVTAHFGSPSDIPVTAAGYTAGGKEVDVSLGFEPSPGTSLMIVRNTALGFITGKFNNLSQGQRVDLTYNGHTHGFVADYYGGSGNDLVLVWERRGVAIWGNNIATWSGDLHISLAYLPVPLKPLGVLEGKTVISLSAGLLRSLVLCSDGTMATWIADEPPVAVDRTGVLAGKTVIAISSGYSHQLALCSDGTVVGWGNNYFGQLGDGTTTEREAPAMVTNTGVLSGKTVVAISAGGEHSLALCDDGTVVAWGRNVYGALGINNGETFSSSPVAVDRTGVLAGKTVTSISAGISHSLASCSDGTVVAWGYNGEGQLGNNGRVTSMVPVAVDRTGVLSGKVVQAVAAGRSHSLALCVDGTLVAWGYSYQGLLGNGQNAANYLTAPVAVDTTGALAGKRVVAIDAEQAHSSALCSDGTAVTWGSNAYGALGAGELIEQSNVPLAVAGSAGFNRGKLSGMALGESHGLAVIDYAGSADLSSLAVNQGGSLSPAFSPEITNYSASVPKDVTAVTLSPTTRDDGALVTVQGAEVISGGVSGVIPIPLGNEMLTVKVTADDGVVKNYTITVTRAEDITMAYQSGTEVPVTAAAYDATGLNVSLSLGFAPPVGTELTVVRNTGLAPIVGRFANLDQGQSVKLVHNGRSYEFVANYHGGTGNDLVLIWAHAKIEAWGGYWGSGALGDTIRDNDTRPTAIVETPAVADKTAISIVAGSGHSLGLFSDGSLAAWGGNEYGQLGTGDSVAQDLAVSVDLSGVPAGVRLVKVDAGPEHSMALGSDGKVYVWGEVGVSASQGRVPARLSDEGTLAGKTVVAISAGYRHALALCSDGTVAGWGLNTNGQLGDGTTKNRPAPTAVLSTGVLAGKVVTAISAASDASMALCSDGTLVFWGGSLYGQSSATSAWKSCVPVALREQGALAGKTVVSIDIGGSLALAFCSDGSAAAWGGNNQLQLGAGLGALSSAVPVEILKPAGLTDKAITAIAAGESHGVANFSGTAVAWGDNSMGLLGRGNYSTTELPAACLNLSATPARSVVNVSTGNSHSLVVVATPADSKLADLALSTGYFTKPFSSSAAGYSAVVKNSASLSVTPTARSSTAGITVGGVSVLSGTASDGIALEPGLNVIDITVTAEDGSSVTYPLTVLRAVDLELEIDSRADVPAEFPFFDATGLTVDITLGFSPALGNELMLLNNTGTEFITGRFTNLAQGQIIELPYNGFLYKFVVNYHGGTGNDLVLQWARRNVVAWGANTAGQLGTGDLVAKLVPVDVSKQGYLNGKTVLQVSVGRMHSLALCSDGTVAAWGNNGSGQLGTGNTLSRLIPMPVSTSGVLAGKTVISVKAGVYHSLALCSDGTLVAWGANDYNQLGNGGAANSNVPVLVNTDYLPPGTIVTAIAAADYHNLVLLSDGRAMTWGYDGEGVLGRDYQTDRGLPGLVDTRGVLFGKTIISCVAGRSHDLVICSDGTTIGWGSGSALGYSTSVGSTPVIVEKSGALAGKAVSSLSAGGYHSLALTTDHTVAAWGVGSSGALGSGAITNSLTPLDITGSGVLSGRAVTAISAGRLFSLAVCSDGGIAGWGFNLNGQLGNGGVTNTSVPVNVTASGVLAEKHALQVAAGDVHNLAIAGRMADSKLAGLTMSIGNLNPAFSPLVTSYTSQVDSAATQITFTPVAPEASIKVNGQAVASGSASGGIALAQGVNDVVVEVTAEDGGVTAYSIRLTRPTDLDVVFTSESTFPVKISTYEATGRNLTMALDFSPAFGTDLPVLENTGGGVIAGRFKNLAQGQLVVLERAGATYKYRANYYGGSGNDLVLQWARSSVVSWGSNNFGQLGNNQSPNSYLPLQVDSSGVLSGKTVMALAGGGSHSLALLSDGSLAGWGYNYNGQLGNDPVARTSSPILVDRTGVLQGRSIIAISAGAGHSLALCADGKVVAWGSNSDGQIGNGSTTATVRVPVDVDASGALLGKTVIAISAGNHLSLALCSDGSIASWGSNSYGELGNQTTVAFSRVPVLVTNTGVLAGRMPKSISAGNRHSVVLCSDGSIVTWGRNNNGQLGNGSASTSSSVPVLVDASGALAGRTVTAAMAGGGDHNMALCSDGTVATWGANNYGQLGNNTTTSSRSPVAVTTSGALAGREIVSISVGSEHGLALCADGRLVSWGDNSAGQLGNGSTVAFSPVPVLVNDVGQLYGKKITALTGDGRHNLVLSAEADSGYLGWTSDFTGVYDKQPSADPDGDGVPNLVEYVLGGNPGVSSTTLLPVLSTTGNNFIFNFNRLASSSEDTSQIFQYSTDMASWVNVEISGVLDPEVVLGAVDGGGKQSVTITIPKGDKKEIFGRLQVRRP